jgi:hypothetical protein
MKMSAWGMQVKVLRRAIPASALWLLALACTPAGNPEIVVALSFDRAAAEVRVVATATNGDGTVGSGSVHISSSAGSLTSGVEAPLDSFGQASTRFSCDLVAEPACSGRISVTAAWTPRAEATVTSQTSIALPTKSGSGGGTGSGNTPPEFAPCAGNTNALYMNGDPDSPIHPGPLTITSGSFVGYRSSGLKDYVRVGVTPADPAVGSFWELLVQASAGTELLPGTYTDLSGEAPTHDGQHRLWLEGYPSKHCNSYNISGSVTVLDVTFAPSATKSFRAVFVQYCEGGIGRTVGCVNYVGGP